MTLDTENKICFVHIAKTGGKTIKMLFGFDEHTHKGGAQQGHLSIEDSSEERKRLAHSDDYFKFTFVRDPVERFISGFFWRRKHLANTNHLGSLKEYIECVGEREFDDPRRRTDFVIAPQSHYFTNTKYDFVGFTETLASDAEKVRQLIGFPNEPFGHVGHYNIGTPKKVKKNINSFVSPDERKAIEEMYEEDCELFKRLKLERG